MPKSNEKSVNGVRCTKGDYLYARTRDLKPRGKIGRIAARHIAKEEFRKA
jgi:hypothetical protein